MVLSRPTKGVISGGPCTGLFLVDYQGTQDVGHPAEAGEDEHQGKRPANLITLDFLLTGPIGRPALTPANTGLADCIVQNLTFA